MKIEVEQTELATQMKLLRWASGTSSAVAKAAGFVLSNETVRAISILCLLLAIAYAVSPSLCWVVQRVVEMTK